MHMFGRIRNIFLALGFAVLASCSGTVDPEQDTDKGNPMEEVPEGVQQLVRFYKKAIERRHTGPFDGYVVDQNGQLRSQEDGYISTNDIVIMDWLLNNIVGEIPSAEKLTQEAQNLIRSTEEGSSDSEGVTEL